MFKFRERKELKEENKKLKKENEELRHAITDAVKRNEELWDSLNNASSLMYAFVSSGKIHTEHWADYLARWMDRFYRHYKESEHLMFHSEYKGLHKCCEEMYWFR